MFLWWLRVIPRQSCRVCAARQFTKPNDSMRLRLRGVCTAAAALAFVPWAIAAFSCEVSESGISYDLRPLGGLRTAVRESDTPPSKSEARADLDLCGNGLPREDGISDQDQASPITQEYPGDLPPVQS